MVDIYSIHDLRRVLGGGMQIGFRWGIETPRPIFIAGEALQGEKPTPHSFRDWNHSPGRGYILFFLAQNSFSFNMGAIRAPVCTICRLLLIMGESYFI
jgi:hypothetical protein